MKDGRDLEQVYRLDGKNCFVENILNGLPYDKVLLNFCQYDKSAAKGQRRRGEVGIFMDIYEAQVFSRDIMSGRIAQLGRASQEKAKREGKKYADAVFESQGGTPAKKTPNGIAIARSFTLSPGASQPWVLCARQGKAHETSEGLIVMDGVPETTIRVPASSAKLKEFALSIETVVRIWEQLRYVPIAAPMVQAAQDRRRSIIDQAKASSVAAANAGRYKG